MLPPVARLAVAYALGLLLGIVLGVPVFLLGLLGLCLVVFARHSGWRGTVGLVFLVGSATGTVRILERARSCAARWEPGPVAAYLRVHDAPDRRRATSGSIVFSAEGCRGTLRVSFDEPVGAGELVIATGLYRSNGFFRVTHHRSLDAARAWRYRIRDRIGNRIRRLYGERAGLVEALVIGRRGDIDRRIRQDFVAGGMAHLLAISGLHVGLLAGWIVLGLRVLGVGRAAAGWSAAAIWGYVILLGFPAAATRAAVFVTVYAFGRLRQRHPGLPGTLAVAVLVIVAVDPHAVTAVGAWLSATAVWGTHRGVRALTVHARRYPLSQLAAASVGATLVTAPITALVFGSVSPIGVLANLAAVPIAGVAVPAVFLSLVVGGGMATGAGLALALLERLAALAATIPGGHVVGIPGLRFAAPWFVLLAVAVWLVERRPSWARIRIRGLLAAAGLSWTLVAATAVRRAAHGDELTLFVLDVGQGDAIALRTPKGRWLLVDGGPRTRHTDAGRTVVTPFLRRHGVARLSALVVTHGDADHLGGVPVIVREFEPELIIEPGQPLPTRLYLEHLGAVESAGIRWIPARAGDSLIVDGVTLEVLHPAPSWVGEQFEPNENSVVVRVRYGCLDVLLAGDAGALVERALAGSVGKVDVLKVGHHGSAGATTEAWLDELSPAVAVISVGGNAYGHPAPAVLERMRRRGISVFRTDRDGTVTIRSDGRYLQVVAGERVSIVGKALCRIRRLLRSSASSSSNNACIPARRVSLPICSTTSR